MNRSPSPLRVIIVEDSKEVVVLLRRHLESCGFELLCTHVEDAAALSAALDEHPWDVVISDHEMPNFSSLGTLKVVSDHGLDTPVIIVSGRVGDSFAASLMTPARGISFPKPISPDSIRSSSGSWRTDPCGNVPANSKPTRTRQSAN